MTQLELNRIAIWRAKNTNTLTTRCSAPGRVYYENNVAKMTEVPTFRHAKNYTTETEDGYPIRYCLMLLTPSDDSAKIEAFLDATSEKLDLEQITKALAVASTSGFLYTDIFYEEEPTAEAEEPAETEEKEEE